MTNQRILFIEIKIKKRKKSEKWKKMKKRIKRRERDRNSIEVVEKRAPLY